MISINLGVIAALKTASIILWTYFIATIFIRLTQTQVFKILMKVLNLNKNCY